MDNVVSGLAFLILGALALRVSLSVSMWQRAESRDRMAAIIAGLVFMTMGIFALLGYIEIKDGW